jgi:hypothetical protein
MHSEGDSGSYRGLYCLISTYGTAETGGVMFSVIGTAILLMCFFGCRTYQLVRNNTMSTSQRNASTMGSGDGSSGGVMDPWSIVARRTLFMVLTSYTPKDANSEVK